VVKSDGGVGRPCRGACRGLPGLGLKFIHSLNIRIGHAIESLQHERQGEIQAERQRTFGSLGIVVVLSTYSSHFRVFS